MDDEELKSHYLMNGANEKREYRYINVPGDFVPSTYKILNPDLDGYTEYDLIHHYDIFGFDEGRKYKMFNVPVDFCSNEYMTLNPDIHAIDKECDEAHCLVHYNNHGYYENREYILKLPDDFDSSLYQHVNKDLTSLNSQQLCLHYHKHGQYEGRKWK